MTDVNQPFTVAEKQPPVAKELPQLPTSAPEPFVVDSLEKADWALEVLGCSEARKTQNQALALEAHRRVDEWLKTVNGQEDLQTSYLRAALQAFMAKGRDLILGKKSPKKSRELPHGTIGWRAVARRLVYDDEDTALAWARAQGVDAGLARVRWAIEKEAVMRYCQSKGIVPLGAHWEGGQEEAVIRPAPPVLSSVPGVSQLLDTHGVKP